MKKLIDKLAVKWLIKRNIIPNLNGEFIRVYKQKAINFLESLESDIWDAQIEAFTLRNNTWDKDCADRLVENLKEFYHYVKYEKEAIENPQSSSNFWEIVLKGKANGNNEN